MAGDAARFEAVRLQRLFREHPEHLTSEQIEAYASLQDQVEESRLVAAHAAFCPDCHVSVQLARDARKERPTAEGATTHDREA